MLNSPETRRGGSGSILMAFVAVLSAMFLLGASSAGAAPARLTKVFGGPVTGACSPDATVGNNQAGRYQNFCVAFRAENDEGPAGKDLASQVIDTPKGFSGRPDGTPQCSDAQFAVTSADDAACPAPSQIGSVAAAIRADAGAPLGIVSLQPTGAVFNLEHSDNEVARLGIDLRPVAFGAVQQPNVKIIVRVTLRPSPDVGLRSIIETLPTTATVDKTILLGGVVSGRPLAVDEFSLTFNGPAQGAMTGPFAFLGSDCSNTQATQIRAVDELGGTSTADSATYQLTGCDSPDLQFLPSAQYTTTENRPDVTTETQVFVRFGQSTNPGYTQTAVKRVATILPEGLSFSGQIASGAAGLPLCSTEQFGQNRAETNTCPDATAVGTVSFKSPLLNKRLTGKAYLGPQAGPGELPDLFIQAELGTAADAPRVKLVGKLTIDDRNRIVATLDNLPEVLVEEFALTFRGGDQSAVVTPPTCGDFKGRLDAFSYANPGAAASSEQSYVVSADCDAVTAFKPGVDFGLDNRASAGKSSPFTTVVARPDRSPRLAKTVIDLPAGMLATLKGVPECAPASAAAGSCPAATRVGSITSLAGVGPAPYQAPGDVYLTERQAGAVAGLVFRVPVRFGDVDLGLLNIPARIEIRGEDLGLRVIADVPERFKGIPLNIRQIAIKLDRQGFPLSPTNCGPLNTTSVITSNNGIVAPATAGLQVSGCDKLRFDPEIDAAVSGQTTQKGRPLVQVRVQSAEGSSALRQTFVTLPKGLGVDLTQIPRSCDIADFKASTCPPVAKIGKVTGALSITDEALSGDLFLLKAQPGKTLPGLGLAFKGRFAGNVAGANAIDTKTGQLITQFETLPDLPLTSFQIDVTGGDGGILIATSALCQSPSVDFAARFVAHSGPTVNKKASTFCGSTLNALTPRIKANLGGVRKGRPTIAMSITAPKLPTQMKIAKLELSLPSGWSLSSSRAKSSKGVAVKKLSVKGRSTSKRINSRKLSVTLPKAGTTGVQLLTRSGTISIASSAKRKTKAKQGFTLKVTYVGGKSTSVPVRLTPR